MRNVNVNKLQNQQSCQTSVMVSADLINKIHNENCLETMAKMPDDFIDLTVTSPPYDGLRDYNGYSFQFEDIAKELYRVTKQGGVVVWVVCDSTIKGSETGTSFKQALYFKECGFNLHDTMFYKKKTYGPVDSRQYRYANVIEYMFVFSKGKPKTFNKLTQLKSEKTLQRQKHKSGGNRRKPNGEMRSIGGLSDSNYKMRENVWEYVNGGNYANDSYALKHPAVFPEQLVQDHIISWSNEGDLVYDPFMGSGTVAKMSILNNRNWIGSEISSEYCEIIKERVKIDKGLFENES